MDPEQIYQEVLQEEQQKGSSPPVAEGRAKAARQRAVHGSPHPKEAKWWEGAQPHLEGGAPDSEAEEEAPEEEVEDEASAEEETPEPEAAPEPEQPAAEETASAEPAAVAEEQPAEQPAAVATAETPAAAAPPMGVKPGTPAGNRLRPEDQVASEAQFDGQRAMEQRRKLIDELVQTGVPAVTASETDRSSSLFVTMAFLLIPVLAILFLVNNDELRETSGGGGTEHSEEEGGEGGGSEAADSPSISAEALQFSRSEIEVPAGEETDFEFDNQDTAPHNIYIYPDAAAADALDDDAALFVGEDVAAGDQVTYTFPALEAGEYPFLCRIHPAMEGTLTAQ